MANKTLTCRGKERMQKAYWKIMLRSYKALQQE